MADVVMTLEEIRRAMQETGAATGSSDGARALGQRIRQARRHTGLTARQLAAAVQLTAGSIYHIEAGAVATSPETLVRIAYTVGRTPDELLGLLPPPEDALRDWPALTAALGDLYGLPQDALNGLPADWPAPARHALFDLLRFAIEPTPDRLRAALAHHPQASAAGSVRALDRLLTRGRRNLADLYLDGSDVVLDALEDAATRIRDDLARRRRGAPRGSRKR